MWGCGEFMQLPTAALPPASHGGAPRPSECCCRMSACCCRGTFGTLAKVAREEGVRSLYKGIVPGPHRQILLGGMRIATCE